MIPAPFDYVLAEHPDHAIEILGKRHAARVQSAPLFDANFERMRA